MDPITNRDLGDEHDPDCPCPAQRHHWSPEAVYAAAQDRVATFAPHERDALKHLAERVEQGRVPS